MKIEAVEVTTSRLPAVQPPYRWRDGLPGSEPAGVGGTLRIMTDDGAEGVARSSRGVILADIVERRLRPELLGADPWQRERIWHRVWELDRIEEFPIYVLGLVDIALWDLAGKVLGRPVYELLGGYRTELPAYASTVTFASVQEYLDVADQCLELGYGAIKLHAWGDARPDAQLAHALRDHVGGRAQLMYDGSAGFDLADAVYLGHALADAGYFWYEEPMREFSITAYKWLGERARVPLLVAETADGAHMNTADFIASGCATFVRTSPGLKAGITGPMRIAHTADSFRLRAEVAGGGPVNVHLCMAIPNTTYYESLVTSNPVARDPNVDARGMVRAPNAPGIGYDQAT
ncbi:MAG TPA: enolase C-terminal domain-like protein [Acidimicrobiales bacterium]|nr:enolase C-terminal domain-like protein [Acidimicrobiales bacterium]